MLALYSELHEQISDICRFVRHGSSARRQQVEIEDSKIRIILVACTVLIFGRLFLPRRARIAGAALGMRGYENKSGLIRENFQAPQHALV